jgi:GNAT superfamily N-acetyltransferase
MLKVRQFQAGDAPAIVRLLNETFPPAGPHTPADLDRDEATWSRRLLDNISVVALEDDQLVGFASLQRTGHIEYLYTHVQWQGQGVGTRLVESLETIANRLHLPRVSAEGDANVRPFFLRNGYRACERATGQQPGPNSFEFVKDLTIDFSRAT